MPAGSVVRLSGDVATHAADSLTAKCFLQDLLK